MKQEAYHIVEERNNASNSWAGGGSASHWLCDAVDNNHKVHALGRHIGVAAALVIIQVAWGQVVGNRKVVAHCILLVRAAVRVNKEKQEKQEKQENTKKKSGKVAQQIRKNRKIKFPDQKK